MTTPVFQKEELTAMHELATKEAQMHADLFNDSRFQASANDAESFAMTAKIAFFERIAHKMEVMLIQK